MPYSRARTSAAQGLTFLTSEHHVSSCVVARSSTRCCDVPNTFITMMRETINEENSASKQCAVQDQALKLQDVSNALSRDTSSNG